MLVIGLTIIISSLLTLVIHAILEQRVPVQDLTASISQDLNNLNQKLMLIHTRQIEMGNLLQIKQVRKPYKKAIPKKVSKAKKASRGAVK